MSIWEPYENVEVKDLRRVELNIKHEIVDWKCWVVFIISIVAYSPKVGGESAILSSPVSIFMITLTLTKWKQNQ